MARPNGGGYGSRCRLHQAPEIRLGKMPEMRGLGRPTAESAGAHDRPRSDARACGALVVLEGAPVGGFISWRGPMVVATAHGAGCTRL